MTTKQELKIKIKEVKEDVRKLTIEEWAMYLLSENGNSVYRHDARDIVKSWGLVEFVNGLTGLFRTETIRDATPKEIIAWHTLQSLYVCSHDMPIQLCSQCANNLGPDGCYIVRTRGRAEGILKGKEVILSVTEE